MRGDSLLDEEHTWADLGRPAVVSLVVKPKTLGWAEDLFEAIDSSNLQEVEKCLKQGQDPDCTMLDSALGFATESNELLIVQTLLLARANVNYVPNGRPGPLQIAALADAEDCAAMLLERRADPNLRDRTLAGNAPLHVAALYGDMVLTDMLLGHGADPLQRNAYGSSPVTLAAPGVVVALCLSECYEEVDWATILLRHSEILASMGCAASFWAACRPLNNHRIRQQPEDLEGGADSFSFRDVGQKAVAAMEIEIDPDMDTAVLFATHEDETTRGVADLCGGSAPSQDFGKQLEAEMDWLVSSGQAPCIGLSLAEETVDCNPQIDDANLQQCKKRRLLPGAAESMPKFQSIFADLRIAAAQSLESASIREPIQGHSLLQQSAFILDQVRKLKPGWPEQPVRVVGCASALPRMRLSDAYLRERIYLIWLMEGGRYLCAHNGQCFLYHDCGAFQVFRGSPPEQTVARVKEFILQVEGFFRSIPPTTDRTLAGIVQVADELNAEGQGGVDELLNQWTSAALFMKAGPHRPPPFGEDDEDEGPRPKNDVAGWPQLVAVALSKLSITLQKEVMDEKVYGLMIEWCETPRNKRAGCAYKDICVVYDADGVNVQCVLPSNENNIYTLIPHPLKPSLPDPVLQAASARLEKFFSETFWRNCEVFQCCQAAQAIAKRGENIDRCFIGESPGGVGQSLYSSHLNAVYGHNHAFIDPSIWYDDQELRKQIEQFAGCFILTAQEAPETTRRVREDLYKKTMGADGMAGRRPYGYAWRSIGSCNSRVFLSTIFRPFCGAVSCGDRMPGLCARNIWMSITRTRAWMGTFQRTQH